MTSALLRAGLSLEDVADQASQFVAESASAVATAMIAILDPAAGTLSCIVAGQVPPMIVHADGTTELLDGVRRPLLGVPRATAGPLVEHRAFPPGSMFVAYTDGLVERRGELIDEGIARLRGVLRGERSARRTWPIGSWPRWWGPITRTTWPSSSSRRRPGRQPRSADAIVGDGTARSGRSRRTAELRLHAGATSECERRCRTGTGFADGRDRDDSAPGSLCRAQACPAALLARRAARHPTQHSRWLYAGTALPRRSSSRGCNVVHREPAGRQRPPPGPR